MGPDPGIRDASFLGPHASIGDGIAAPATTAYGLGGGTAAAPCGSPDHVGRCLTNVPFWNSSTASSISLRLFITMGPHHATGSWRGLTETSWPAITRTSTPLAAWISGMDARFTSWYRGSIILLDAGRLTQSWKPP